MFAPDVEDSLRCAVALVNSAEPPDLLTSVEELRLFFASYRYTGLQRGTAAELQAIRVARPILRYLLSGSADQAVELTNRILRDSRAIPQLVRHDEFDWHIHAVPPGAPLSTRVLVETAMAMTDVLRAGALVRISVCEASRCERLVLDLSKNRSRRFCSVACGNRMAAAAYRKRVHGPSSHPMNAGQLRTDLEQGTE